MSKRKIVCVIIFLMIVSPGAVNAQGKADSIVYYLDKDLKTCPIDQMYYVGFGVKENGLVRMSVFTTGIVKLALTGFYTDSTLAKREGEFHDYDETGHSISTVHFHLDTIYGYSVYLTRDYMCQDSILYENGKDVMSISYNYSNKKKLTRVVNDIRTGVKEFTRYYDDGSIQTFGHWQFGNGEQTEYFILSTKVKTITSYTNNKITGERHFSENGAEIPPEVYKQQIEAGQQAIKDSKPSYPGGMTAFSQYIYEHMWDLFWAQRYSISVSGNKYNLVFWLNKNGEIYDLKVNQLQSNDPIFISFWQALATAPKWNMKNKADFGPVYFSMTVLRQSDTDNIKISFP